MRKYLRRVAPAAAGVAAAAIVSFTPGIARATVTGAPFTAFDSNGALVTQHSVFNGEHLAYKGQEVTVVYEITRFNGFGGYYYQFHTTPANVLGGTTGIVTLVPVS